jgi:hypothetical protein
MSSLVDTDRYLTLLLLGSSMARELPGNTPYVAKLKLIQKFVNLYPPIVARCLQEVKTVVEEHFVKVVEAELDGLYNKALCRRWR